MDRERIELYDGKLKANCIGAFTRGGIEFSIIRPGYDSQGRRRQSWTQFVVGGVPVFEVKKKGELSGVLAQFDALWAQHIQDDAHLLKRAVAACRAERLAKFMDGATGESPAPTSPGSPKEYPA